MGHQVRATRPKCEAQILQGRNARMLLSFCLVALAAFVAGCGGGSSAPPPPPPTANPVPSIASLSPSSATVGAQAQTLTIQGSNYLSISTVTYNGQTHTATFVSSTQLTVSLSASDQATAGNYPVVVSNPAPGGGQSNSINFTVNNPQPVLTSASPSVLAGGSPDTLISVVGANFVGQSIVNLNGTALPTSFVSSTQLGVTVPASSLATGRIIRVTVTTPAPGGGTSGSLNLTVTELLPAGVSGPLIQSLPPTAAVVGKPIQYQVLASSANPSSLVFSLSASPAGMTINATTGLLQWTPGPNQAGDQPVTIVAEDSAGQTSQTFTLSVFGGRPLASATISAAAGGVITVNDPTSTINGLSISIPAGALAADTTITVSELASPPTLGGTPHFLMKGFAVEPDGIFLAIPATIMVPYSVSEFGSGAGIPLESFLGVYFLQTETGNLEWLDGFSADRVKHVITGSVSHFSAFVPTNGFELCAPPAASSPGFTPDDCPSDPHLSASVSSLPVVLVHGFLGNRTTWDRLPALLGQQGIRAWRFDWPSLSTSFETAAGKLGEPDGGALQAVEGFENTSVVNLVGHSFGGILVRTYLEDKASSAPYRVDVNRVMTLGTPHSGIGGNLSTFKANACAWSAQLLKLPMTCFEASTGIAGSQGTRADAGLFLNTLNSKPLPALNPSLTPQYDLIAGQRVSCLLVSCSLQNDDGLITTAGNQLCGTLPGGGIGFPNECSGLSVVEELNPGVPANMGLCHSGALFNPFGTCQTGFNTAMAAIDSESHPLWSKICAFLGGRGCTPVAGTHTLTVVSTNPSSGVHITVSPADNNGNVGGNTLFTLAYNDGTAVTLTAEPTAGGNNFATWTGCDSTFGTGCIITMNADRTVSANYVLPGTSTLTVASTNPISGVTITVSPSDNNGQGNGVTPFMRTYNNSVLVSLGAPSTAGGNNFASWTGCDSVSGTNCTVTMNTNQTVTASYVKPTRQPRFAYVANQTSGDVSAYGVDPVSGALNPIGSFTAGFFANWVAADPLGRCLYTANLQDSIVPISVFAIDPNSGSLTPKPHPPISLNEVNPVSVTVHPTGPFAYVANLVGNVTAFSINFSTCELTRIPGSPYPAGSFPTSVATDPAGKFLYVTNSGSNNISAYSINSSTGALTPLIGSPIPTGVFPSSVTVHPTGTFAFATNELFDNTVSVYQVDATSGLLIPQGPVAAGAGPASVAVDPSGKFVYVANLADGNVEAFTFNPTTGALTPVDSFGTGASPISVAVDPSGKFLYVANNFSNSVSAFKIDPSTGALSPVPPVGFFPAGAFPASVTVTAGP
jgi:6-phosphogluconolactonase